MRVSAEGAAAAPSTTHASSHAKSSSKAFHLIRRPYCNLLCPNLLFLISISRYEIRARESFIANLLVRIRFIIETP